MGGPNHGRLTLPLITAQCRSAERIYIVNYVQGAHIFSGDKTIASKVDPNRHSDGLSIAVYSLNTTLDPKYGWAYGPAHRAALVLLTPYGRRFRSRYGADSEYETLRRNSNLTSISRYRELWKASIDEARKLEAVRIAEEAGEAEVRKRARITRLRAKASVLLN